MTESSQSYRPATLLVQGGVDRSPHGETAEALYLTSGFVYDSAEQAEATFKNEIVHYQYSRFGNPTVSMFENRLALLEGAEACRATATGMAAVHAALLSHLKCGDRVVASRALFGSCHWIVSSLLPRYGISTEFVDGGDLEQWGKALATPTNLVLLETPSNPMLEMVDLTAVAKLAHAAGAIVVVDNVFATPLPQKPSTPWQALLTISNCLASAGPSRTTSMANTSPSRPGKGCTWLCTASPASCAACRNFLRASS